MGQILISAANKSSGKTIVSTGLCAALTSQGKIVQPFKKGPDYIDPMWLSAAAKRPCYNLDFWTQTEPEIVSCFSRNSDDADISIIEANKGLYDGLALDGSNSNAALAKLLNTSVILVLDCRGTIRGIAPLLMGYQQFDPQVNIAGIILNFVGGSRHEAKLRQVVETYTDIPVLGAIQRDDHLLVEERYLGLIPSNEDPHALSKIQALGENIAAQVDCQQILACAAAIPKTQITNTAADHGHYPVRIAYAKDRAFGFYYADDLDTFRAHGAELIAFDTLHDSQLPSADALWLGGGFPEKCITELHNNHAMREDIHQKLSAGMPAYAECGGLMYLCENIHYQSQCESMVGLIPAQCHMSDRPQGRGYTQFKENSHSLWSAPSDQIINAHEFHYSYLQNLDQHTPLSFDIKRGHGIDQKNDGIRINNTLACYAHQRHTQQNPWISRFLKFVNEQAQCD